MRDQLSDQLIELGSYCIRFFFLCSLLAPAVAGWVVNEGAPLYGPNCSVGHLSTPPVYACKRAISERIRKAVKILP